MICVKIFKSNSTFYWYLSTEFYYQNFCLSFPCSTLNKYSHIQIIYQLSSLYNKVSQPLNQLYKNCSYFKQASRLYISKV